METPEIVTDGGEPLALLRAMQIKHAQIMDDWGLITKIRRYAAERASGRDVESFLMDGLPLVLGSVAPELTQLFIGFRLENPTRTKLVPVCSKHTDQMYFQPDSDDFNDTDCLVLNELFTELQDLQACYLPNYDPQFGIMRS